MTVLEQAIEILERVNAVDISVFEFNGKSPFYDYFLVGTVNERAGSAAVGYFSKELKDQLKSIEGKDNSGWVLIDLGDVVVHLFKKEDREFYGFDQRFVGLKK